MQPTHRLLGLTGHAGSGKDYVHALLDGMLPNGNVIRVALADEVRFEIEATLAPGQHLPAVWDKPYRNSVRRLLQWWGTDFRRAQDPEYWVEQTRDTILTHFEEREDEATLIVVTDVRFDNEAAMVRNLGGFVAEVRASDDIRAERLGGSLPPAHASEVIDFDTDGVIENDSETTFPQALVEYLR